jgi:hypothetical protein
MSGPTLDVAADQVAEEFRRHAAACLASPTDVATIVSRGEALRRAVLVYENVLGDTTGWSNPLRHLDDEDQEGQEASSEEATSSALDASRIQVSARYYLRIEVPEKLLSYVRTRFGQDVNDVVEAMEKIYQSDSWKPDKYQSGLLHIEDVAVDVFLEE